MGTSCFFCSLYSLLCFKLKFIEQRAQRDSPFKRVFQRFQLMSLMKLKSSRDFKEGDNDKRLNGKKKHMIMATTTTEAECPNCNKLNFIEIAKLCSIPCFFGLFKKKSIFGSENLKIPRYWPIYRVNGSRLSRFRQAINDKRDERIITANCGIFLHIQKFKKKFCKFLHFFFVILRVLITFLNLL